MIWKWHAMYVTHKSYRHISILGRRENDALDRDESDERLSANLFAANVLLNEIRLELLRSEKAIYKWRPSLINRFLTWIINNYGRRYIGNVAFIFRMSRRYRCDLIPSKKLNEKDQIRINEDTLALENEMDTSNRWNETKEETITQSSFRKYVSDFTRTLTFGWYRK